MGVVQLRQVTAHIEANYAPLVDISDCRTRSDDDQRTAKLTRGLAAFAIGIRADVDQKAASGSVVDGFNDNGIDAILYADQTLYLCQSKWSRDGTGSIDAGSCEKLVRGVKDLLNLRFEHFGDKVAARVQELSTAIEKTARVEIIIAYSGTDRLGEHPKRVIDSCLNELNDTGDVAGLTVLAQEQLYAVVVQGGRADPVHLDIHLFDWGQTKTPFQAFYGQVAASDVADWGLTFGQRVFSKNIRGFLGASTSVNLGIADSITRAPDRFWYLNNGITALCSAIRKRPIGGASHDAGTFECSDVAIVNGAQTVGAIAELSKVAKPQLGQARMPIRLISLEGCPPEFAMEVTRATNTQNRVDSGNFVALDPLQERLRTELLVDGIEYEFRQGEGEPNGVKKFGLVDATVALACAAADVEQCVQAKREISKLWEDLERPPYKLMFNTGLTGLRLWHWVQMLRTVDSELDDLKANSATPREKNLASHSNRLVAHLVLTRVQASSVGTPQFSLAVVEPEIRAHTRSFLLQVEALVGKLYGDSYPANVFKNVSKCKEISSSVSSFAA